MDHTTFSTLPQHREKTNYMLSNMNTLSLVLRRGENIKDVVNCVIA